MIDILVYLFENYQPDACPAPTVLAKKLTAAGFEAEDISAALTWLEGLAGHGNAGVAAADPRSVRVFGEAEFDRLVVGEQDDRATKLRGDDVAHLRAREVAAPFHDLHRRSATIQARRERPDAERHEPELRVALPGGPKADVRRAQSIEIERMHTFRR